MRTWVIKAGGTSTDALTMVERDVPTPGPGEIVIRVRACSLNYRDQAIVRGAYMGGAVPNDTIPLSDGVGDVAEVGEGVSAYKQGDKVAGLFFQGWQSGPPNPNAGAALGMAGVDGMLSEYVVLPATGVVPMAKTLSFEEAATLPCAGVTAWNALMESNPPCGPGRKVLVLGTGGVSLLALQIAKAAGASVYATSSSDEKLQRAIALGATQGVNYKHTPEWGAEVVRVSGGGVDHVVEIGGQGTLAQSMAALGFNGEIALIGFLGGPGDAAPRDLMFKGGRLRGIFVGSADMANQLNAVVDRDNIKPVIDRVFPFEDAVAAYNHQSDPGLFGKIVIAV